MNERRKKHNEENFILFQIFSIKREEIREKCDKRYKDKKKKNLYVPFFFSYLFFCLKKIKMKKKNKKTKKSFHSMH